MATDTYLVNRKKYGRPQAMLWSENPGTLSNGLFVPDGYEVDAVVPDNADPSLIDQFIIISDHNRSALDFKIERIEQRERMINGRMRSYYIDDKITISTSWDNLPSRAFKRNPGWESYTRQADVLDILQTGASTLEITVDASLTTFHVGDLIDITGTNITGFNFKGKPITNVILRNDQTILVVSSTATGNYLSGGTVTISNVSKDGVSQLNNTESQYTVDGGAGGLDLLEWYESHPGSFWVYLAYDKYTNFGRNDEDYQHLNQYNEVIEMYITDFSYTVEKRGGNFDLWNVSISLEEV